MNPLARRRYRRWCARSADHLNRSAGIAVVAETTPHNLVGVGDQVVAATRELCGYLAEDPCPEPALASVHALVLSAYAALGTILILFEGYSAPAQVDALARVHRLEGEVATLASVEALLVD
jgi:hypothetical protein